MCCQMHMGWQPLTHTVNKQTNAETYTQNSKQTGMRRIQSLAQTADVYPLTHPYLQYYYFPSVLYIQIFWEQEWIQLANHYTRK